MYHVVINVYKKVCSESCMGGGGGLRELVTILVKKKSYLLHSYA